MSGAHHERTRHGRANAPTSLGGTSFKLANLDPDHRRQQPLEGSSELASCVGARECDEDAATMDSRPEERQPSSSRTNRMGFIGDQTSSASKSYPNNTLVEDLSKCHDNLQPKAVQATRRVLKFISSCPLRPDSKTASKPAESRDARTDLKSSPSAPTKPPDGAQERAQDTKKRYRFLMPNSIQRLNSTLTLDDYDRALRVLTGDMRYKLHLLLFNRLQMAWTLIGTVACVVVALLTFTVATAVATGLVWFALQAAGLVACKRARKLLDQMLERSVAQANTFFMDHKLMVGVINVGGFLSQCRFVVPMLYFDAMQCIEQVDLMIGRDLALMENQRERRPSESSVSTPGEANGRVLARTQLAKKIVLDHSQRWISHFDRSKLMLIDDGSKPRHLSTGKCLCQFIEENLGGEDAAEETDAKAAEQTSSKGRETRIDIWTKEGAPMERRQANELASATIKTRLADGYSELNIFDLIRENGKLDPCDKDKPLELERNELGASKFLESSTHTRREHARASSSSESELSSYLDTDDCPNRSELLSRNLRLLFELRASELSGSLDGSSSIAMVNWGKISPSISDHDEQGRDRPASSMDDSSRDGRERKLCIPGRKFFSRIDEVFSLSSRGSKGGGFYASSSRQMLDIC